MMALFIVLWILNQSEDVKRGVGGYFRDPQGVALLGAGPETSKDKVLGPKMVATPAVFKRMAANAADLEKSARELREMLKDKPGLKELGDQITIEVTKEGIRVEIVENDSSSIFEVGSSKLTPRLIRALEILAKEYAKLPSPVIIEGHTDSTPYASNSGMSNWELSTQRANEARHVLEHSGLQGEKVFMVRGYADRKPFAGDPADPRNRRISMLLLSSQGLEMNLGSMTEQDTKRDSAGGDEVVRYSEEIPGSPEPVSVATRGK
jgi:chemotaxis protein MotB